MSSVKVSSVKGYEIKLIENGEKAAQSCHLNVSKSNIYRVDLYFTKFPTSNCQLSSIGPIANLLQFATERADVQAIIRECYRLINYATQIILLDVKTVYIPKVEKCFTVRTKTPYTSTNNSPMCLYLVTLDPPVQQ